MQAASNIVAGTASSTTHNKSSLSTLNSSRQLNDSIKNSNSKAVKNISTEPSIQPYLMRLQVPDNIPGGKLVGNQPTPKRPKRTSSSSSVKSSTRLTARSSPRFYKGNKKRSPLIESNIIIG